VGLLSPLPFFVSRLMPGAFTGPLILAFVSLILFGAHYGRLARTFLFMVAAAAITFHISHILLILSVGARLPLPRDPLQSAEVSSVRLPRSDAATK